MEAMVVEGEITRPDPRVLEAALSFAERQLASQLAIADGRIRKLDSLVRLSVAALAGILAVIGLLLNGRVPLGWVSLVGFGSGVVLILVALVTFLNGVTGLSRPYTFALGPRISGVVEAIAAGPLDRATFLFAALEDVGKAIEGNDRTGALLDARASTGNIWLLAGVVCHIGMLAFILGRMIHA